MRRHLALIAGLAFLLSGCIQLELLVKVKKDGTGTLYETVLFDTALLGELIGRMPGQAKNMPKPWDFDEAELRAQASKKGKGVEYVSAKPVTKGSWKGFKAEYTFSDVGQLEVDPDPGKHAPQAPGQPPPKKADPMRFRFKKGRTSKLTVLLPRDDEAEKKRKKNPPKKLDPNDPSFEMMRSMLKDMSVDIAVELEGKVVSSNASFRKGNRVTLLALDFNKLVGDAEKLAKVMNARSFEESAKAFNSVKGMQIEPRRKITTAFR